MGSRLLTDLLERRTQIMPEFKLTYFNLRGRGELSRLIFVHAGQKYEDDRIASPFEDPAPWVAFKPNTPWGTLPILSIDGQIIAQSVASARYLAREFGLVGKNNLESAQADEIMDVVTDLVNEGTRAKFANDEPASKKHTEETIPRSLANIEKVLVARGGQYLVGGALTWADIALFNYVNAYKPALDKIPSIKTLVEKVGNLPNIKSWVESRPVTNI